MDAECLLSLSLLRSLSLSLLLLFPGFSVS